MCPNNLLQDKNSIFFFTAEYEASRNVVCINMTSQGIEIFLKILNKFSKKNEVVIGEDQLTNDDSRQDFIFISQIIIQYKSIDTEHLILNLVDGDRKLYIFCSEKGINRLMNCLMSLRGFLKKGEPEDISFMIEEWGGDWLLNEKIIEGSDVICHLRLYGILG